MTHHVYRAKRSLHSSRLCRLPGLVPTGRQRGRLFALGLLLAVLTGACGPASAGESRTSQTLGSAIADLGESAISASTVQVPEGEWAPDEVIKPALGPLSTALEIKQAIEDVHGPTNDIAEQMNRFVAFPDVRSPERPEILELRADVRDTLDGEWMIVTSEVSFTVDGTAAEVIEFYIDELSGLDWLATDRSELLQTGVVVHHLRYEIPDTEYALDDFELQVRSQPDFDGTARSRVDLRYLVLEPLVGTEAPVRFAGWAADIPVPDGGRITGAGIQTSSVGRDSLHYSLTMTYDQKDPPTVAAELRSLFPAGGFTIEPQPASDDATDNWVYLRSSFFDDSRISTHDAADVDGAATLVNIDARVGYDRQPYGLLRVWP